MVYNLYKFVLTLIGASLGHELFCIDLFAFLIHLLWLMYNFSTSIIFQVNLILQFL